MCLAPTVLPHFGLRRQSEAATALFGQVSSPERTEREVIRDSRES